MKKQAFFSDVPIHTVKEFWNRRPCNIRHSKASLGSKEYFDEVEKRKFFVEPHLFTFADFSSLKGKKILEIGCGIGTVTVNFAKAGAKKVVAVDLSEKSLEMAKKQAEVYGFSDRIHFHLANAEELSKSVPKEEFDLIFSFGVIHHTPHPEKILEELKEYLSPKGRLKIMVYHRYSWKTFWILCKYGKFRFWELSKLIASYSEAKVGCPITYAYSKHQGKKLVESKGFRVTDLKIDHIFPYRVSDYVNYRYVKVWYFRMLPKWIMRFLEKMIGWHLCITAEKDPN